jgi:hypothetical protein
MGVTIMITSICIDGRVVEVGGIVAVVTAVGVVIDVRVGVSLIAVGIRKWPMVVR